MRVDTEHPRADHRVTGPARGRATHAARPGVSPLRFAAGGAAAALAGMALLAINDSVDSNAGVPTTARLITVTPQVPLPDAELAALTVADPDFGPLADPTRRAECLKGLGYAETVPVLGARPVQITGRPAVVLVLPGQDAGAIVGVAVGEDCSGSRPGPIADTTVRRP